ncbi:MAG: HAMP domain-containing sensor histidine kinase [Pirellulaceae bacterium]
MRRPWQIWLLFLLGAALVAAPMAWLTLKALELDRAELQARQQIEVEERVSRALWRMDVLLMPLLAQEAARPALVYGPSVTTLEEGKGKPVSRQSASPLLVSPPDYVLVHFEVTPDGSLSSPQCPPGKDSSWAEANGVASGRMETARQRLDQLASSLHRDELLAMLPEESLPPLEVAGVPWNTSASNMNRSQIVANTFDQTQLFNPPGGDAAPSEPQTLNAPAQPPPLEPGPPAASQQQVDIGQQAAQSQSPSRVFASNNPRSQSRLDNDLQSRGQAYQAVAQRAYQEQRQNFGNFDLPAGATALEGVSQPLWIGERLILGRRVKSGTQTLIQGCWLDWERLEARLRDEVSDLNLPEVRFVPLTNIALADQNHLLATLPVQLAVGVPTAEPAWDSPIRISLLVAWTCLALAAVFAAVTLQGVVALSERRGAFVSAVTHELRTPLTTFRMYAEMLAEGMVPTAEQRQKYLDTLRREADRLAHLVENVLQYARLERGSPDRRKEEISLAALLDRIEPRLTDRAEQAEMKLVVEIDDAARETVVKTDGGAVEQILFNLVDNACKYAAAADDKRIHVRLAVEAKRVLVRVCDHGPGIEGPARRKLFRPFSKSVHEAAHTAPGVGLGLALSKRLASDLGGRLEIAPFGGEPCAGAVFVLTLPRD